MIAFTDAAEVSSSGLTPHAAIGSDDTIRSNNRHAPAKETPSTEPGLSGGGATATGVDNNTPEIDRRSPLHHARIVAPSDQSCRTEAKRCVTPFHVMPPLHHSPACVCATKTKHA